jgi:hypothetical protein
MFGMNAMNSGENNMATTLNVENNQNQNMMNSATNQTSTKGKGFLGRINKKTKEEEMQMIQKNIDNSMKVNSNELINPGEMNVRSSMFFRLHVTGIIESANVNIHIIFSFAMAMLYFVNTI